MNNRWRAQSCQRREAWIPCWRKSQLPQEKWLIQGNVNQWLCPEKTSWCFMVWVPFKDEVSRFCQSGAIKSRTDLSEVSQIWGIPSKLSIRGYHIDKYLQTFTNQSEAIISMNLFECQTGEIRPSNLFKICATWGQLRRDSTNLYKNPWSEADIGACHFAPCYDTNLPAFHSKRSLQTGAFLLPSYGAT